MRRFERADVLYPSAMEFPAPFLNVDDYVAQAERYEHLQAGKRMTVVLCRSWGDFFRFLPLMSSRALAGATLGNGRVIYLTPKLREKNLAPGEFLRHEIAHAVLHQNQTMLNALRAARQEWFTEGLAVSAGAQKSFVSAQEFVERSRRQSLSPVIDPEQRSAAPVPFDMRFAYQTWRFFLEYLIETNGKERFHRYTAAYAAEPLQYRELFVATYGVELPEAVRSFEDDVRSGRWRPAEDFLSKQFGERTAEQN